MYIFENFFETLTTANRYRISDKNSNSYRNSDRNNFHIKNYFLIDFVIIRIIVSNLTFNSGYIYIYIYIYFLFIL
jgi:hypothetical protein